MTFWPKSTPFALKPLKRTCEVNPEALPESTDPDYEFDYIDIGNVTLERGISGRQRMAFANSPSRARKPLRGGDIIVSTVRTYLKAVAAVPEEAQDWVASTGFAVLRPNHEVDQRFLYRVVQSNPFVEAVVAVSTGVSYPAINPSTLGTISVPIPDRETQRAIADFLDCETARIDQLVEKKQALVAALKQKTTDIADLLVTGAEDPTRQCTRVDSPWLSEIPTDWQLIRAKFLFEEMKRPVEEDDEVITAFRDGQVCLRSRRRTEGYTFAELEVGYQHICKGDLVIHTMDAFAGAIGVSEDDGKSTGEYAVCRPQSEDVIPEYYAYALRCMARRNYIFVLCPSVRERAPRFRFVRFAPVFLPVPPRDEQLAIVSRIENETAQLRAVQDKTIESIDRLREYRAALITAAVTGEIDVSENTRKGDTDRRLDAIEAEMRA